ncbi:hypothetical protein [Streptosporangium vulgare]|uniref:hypothetical protein n=1 Tax=Streptosporangium vulgare TaxID=46190 RepID=UPI0031D114E9
MIKARRARAKGRRQAYAAVSRLLTPSGAGYRRLVDRCRATWPGAGSWSPRDATTRRDRLAERAGGRRRSCSPTPG